MAEQPNQENALLTGGPFGPGNPVGPWGPLGPWGQRTASLRTDVLPAASPGSLSTAEPLPPALLSADPGRCPHHSDEEARSGPRARPSERHGAEDPRSQRPSHLQGPKTRAKWMGWPPSPSEGLTPREARPLSSRCQENPLPQPAPGGQQPDVGAAVSGRSPVHLAGRLGRHLRSCPGGSKQDELTVTSDLRSHALRVWPAVAHPDLSKEWGHGPPAPRGRLSSPFYTRI